MHDDLLQFKRNDIWTLEPRPEDEHIIGTKWIFHNKTDVEEQCDPQQGSACSSMILTNGMSRL